MLFFFFQRWETCLAPVAPPSSLCITEPSAPLQRSSCSSRWETVTSFSQSENLQGTFMLMFTSCLRIVLFFCFVFCPCSWYMNLASLSEPASSSCQCAASFTCSELYSSCQEKSFHTHCLTTTHTGIDDVHQKCTTFFNQFFQKHFWTPLKNRVNILFVFFSFMVGP